MYIPDEDYEARLHSLLAVVPMETSDMDLSGTSGAPGIGVVSSTVQASDNSIPVLPLLCTSISQTSV